MNRQIALLIIDPQNDFCDLPEAWRGIDPVRNVAAAPALPVSGAHADMQRLAELIDAGGAGLSSIVVTFDSHQRYDIAHPTFWQTGAGEAVSPFTAITAAQVRAGNYAPRNPAALPRTLAYLDALEQAGRYTLMVWPVHCEIGSWGHNVHPAVKAAYNRWEDQRLGVVQKVTKGTNPWTEHYSALQAEVPDAADPDTQLNRDLIAQLDEADLIVIAGEASSHCVKATTEHIALHLPSRQLGKLLLLTDAMSPVTGFETQAQAFLDDMQRQGARLATCAQVLPLLQANA
ncbi:cysteine hydrolase [Hydrogenophaga taeniospiralis]|uniref:cysteine hydrolase n=1 Tax=Hydrogenophaga taeniospiralis TaxID=65656 RepID=UPI001CFC371E|nr:cysteine hydrolase [Hydrogenophaga taeniospiralis]MCB4362778.1 cysteine hydrolase [Hydrogenophaga taeniospiralis]